MSQISQTQSPDDSLARTVQHRLLSRNSFRLMLFCIIVSAFGFISLSPSHKETNMSSHRLSIAQTNQLSQSDQIKRWIGRMVTSVLPNRAKELYRAPMCDPTSFADKAIMFHLRQIAIDENRTGFLERYHQSFWTGNQGAEFAHNCDHRFQDLFLDKQQEDFRTLQVVWESLAGRDIVEIGTNSGQLLEYMTKNLVHVNRATGIDINEDQINRNRQSACFDPRVDFIHTDGRQWVVSNAVPFTLFVTNGGVLEYFRRDKLDEMLSHISASCNPSVFFASEPIAFDHDLESNNESVPFGDELSFSHNYKDLFESNGFNIVHQRPVEFESWKMLTTIAITKSIPSKAV